MAAYTIIDDFVNGAGALLSGGSGQPQVPTFQATTLGQAQTTAQQYATMFQRQVRLVPIGGAAPFTQYVPAAAGSALGAQATGISF